jgi:hypothetical protein
MSFLNCISPNFEFTTVFPWFLFDEKVFFNSHALTYHDCAKQDFCFSDKVSVILRIKIVNLEPELLIFVEHVANCKMLNPTWV